VSRIDTAPYRERLVEERARLANAIQFLEHENPGSLGDELGELATAGDNHLGDTASATFDRELDHGLEARVQQTVRAIDDALGKIDDGTYGLCEVCGNPIAEQRLQAIPWARLCIDDQRRANA
jgi:DnaK suppressor protein